MFEFLALVIALIAILMVRNAGKRIAKLEQRAATLEQRLAGGASAAAATTGPEPLPDALLLQTEPVTPAEPFAPAEAAASAEPGMQEAAPELPPELLPTPVEPSKSFEERFGANWTVWIGGIALALGGVFLVQYSIEAGLIGPGVRIALGALLAAVLIGAGEWMRRRDQSEGVAGLPSAHIPSILTAAGTTVAYAVIYAAYALYGFLGPASAFVLLGLVALATMTAALLHGPALAALGQVGAFVAPLLVATNMPNYWALYIYIAVVTAASFVLARARLWRWLALTAVIFGLLWSFPGMGDLRVDSLMPHAFHIVVGFALVAALLVSGLLYGPEAEPGRIDEVSCAGLVAYLFAAAIFVIARQHDALALSAFTLLTAATVVIAWRTDAAAGAIPLAGIFAAMVIGHWAVNIDWHTLVAPAGVTSPAVPEPGRAFYGTHLALGFFYAALLAATGFLAQGRSPRAEPPILWAATAVLAPLAILIALYYKIYDFERSIPFAAIALAIAALFAVATELLTKREQRPGMPSAAAIFATGTIAALALALTFALEKGWLTVALALMVPGTAYVAEKRPLPWLRWLSAILVGAVMLRIGHAPLIVGDVGETPIFNWLLYGYGVPALAFWVAGWLLRRRADDVPARITDAAAILFTVLTGFLQIRHYVNSGDIYYESADLLEVALQVCGALALAIGLERIRVRTGSIVHDVAAQMLAVFALGGIVLGLGLFVNPWFSGAPVGGLFVNLILLGYGLPAILVAALGLMTRPTRPELFRTVAAVAAVALALGYLSLEVARFYHGPVLTDGSVTDPEQYTYSAVWLGFGVALLLVGIFLRSQPVRMCSAAVVMLTIGKVFLVDMAGLTGVWRAFSLIGLGIVLVGIGRLYQKLLFARKPPAPEAEAA